MSTPKNVFGIPPMSGLDLFTYSLIKNNFIYVSFTPLRPVIGDATSGFTSTQKASGEFQAKLINATGLMIPFAPYQFATSPSSIRISLSHEYGATRLETLLTDILRYENDLSLYFDLVQQTSKEREMEVIKQFAIKHGFKDNPGIMRLLYEAAARGANVDIMDYYLSSTAHIGFSFTITLLADNPMDDAEYQRQILIPLAILQAMGGLPNVDNTVTRPFLWEVCIPGFISLKQAGVTNVDIEIDAKHVTYQQRPRRVNVTVSVRSLWRYLFWNPSNNESKGYLSIGDWISAMSTTREVSGDDLIKSGQSEPPATLRGYLKDTRRAEASKRQAVTARRLRGGHTVA